MNISYKIGHTLFRLMGKGLFSFKVKDKDKLLLEGPVLLVANHQSFIDPPLLGSIHDKPIYFLARKSLFKGIFKPLYHSWQAVPIDQENPDMTGLKTIISLLKKGEKVLIFPEGSRSFDDQFLPALPGVGLIISKAKVPVQPLRIFNANQALQRGKKIPRCVPVSATVGEPIAYTPEELSAKGKDAYQHLADKAMEAVKALTP